MIYDEIAYYKQQTTQEMFRKVGIYIYATFLKVDAVLEVHYNHDDSPFE
jgi:hypothetical protein